MENSFYTGIARAQALQSQMDVISNNIANMNTPGYRDQSVVFEQYLTKGQITDGKDNSDDRLAMVREHGMYKSTASGEIQKTGNPLDVALTGKGWMGVQTAAGTMYTRNGSFQLNSQGQIVTGSGQTVASSGGGAITVPASARSITITQEGQVVTDKGAIGNLMLVEFPNEQQLQAVGNGLYKLGDGGSPPTPAKNTQVTQGALEGSNVQPITEMTKMLGVTRAYEQTQNLLSDEHDREREMIQTLTKTE